MTTKEKAKELIEKFRYNDSIPQSRMEEYKAKQCAIICVDEIIQQFKEELSANVTGHYKIDYWQQVKTEIQSL